MIKRFLFLCLVSTALLIFYRTTSVLAASISIPANPSDCPQLMPLHPDWCKDGKIITGGKDEKGCQLPPLCEKETNNQTYPRYGHANDYSWVSGKLQYEPFEGGRWLIIFSETQKDENNFFGNFSLDLTQAKKVPELELKSGLFVILTGEILGETTKRPCTPELGCSGKVYKVSGILNNDYLQTVPGNTIEWIISPDPGKCKPSPCTTLTVKKIPGGILIKDDSAEAKTTLPIKMDGEKITVGEGNLEKKIIPPSTAKQSVEGNITNILLDYCSSISNQTSKCNNDMPVYKIDVSKNTNFLSIIPFKIDYFYTVDASTGEVISDTKPWFLKRFSVLFR